MYTDRSRYIKTVTLSEMHSVNLRQKTVGKSKDPSLLLRAETCYNKRDDERRARARAIRFAYGDQWGDTIIVNGKPMTQRQYLTNQGNVVIQTNQIKNKVETLVGVLVKEQNEPTCFAHDRVEQQYAEVLSVALKANCEKNKLTDLYIKFMRDLCLGGLAVAHETFDRTSGPHGSQDSWTQYVEPSMMFFDSEMQDPRFWDMSLIGQFFDLSFEDVCAKFVRNERDYAILKAIYPEAATIFKMPTRQDYKDVVEDSTLSFYDPADKTRCRVFEIWTKETRPRIRLHDVMDGTESIIDADDSTLRSYIRSTNNERKELYERNQVPEEERAYIMGDGFGFTDVDRDGFFIDEYWYCRFLAPDGTILWEGESPYPDRQHPFSICAIPFVAGKISGYMTDAIDHNIAINRAIVLHDWLIRSQAKGVTVVPKAIVPDDMSLEQFAESWTAIDDMVFINMKEGQEGLMPKVFYGSSQTFNVSDLINTYSQLMENSTAVSGAIQGKTPYAGTSGSLYAQMASHASTPIAGLLSQFHSFLETLHTKKAKNIAAFYETSRFEKIAGSISSILDSSTLNLHDIADMEFDLAIKESTATPTYRAILRDDLKEFLANGFITFDEFLEFSDEPYADEMLQRRATKQQQMQQQEMQQLSPDATMNPQQTGTAVEDEFRSYPIEQVPLRQVQLHQAEPDSEVRI